jgi:hypothetical protein
MKLLPASDVLDRVSGIEDGLRENRRTKRLGTVGLLLAAAQLSVGIRSVVGGDLLQGQVHWVASLFVALGAFVLALSMLLVARSRLWLKESSEPFRYTCSLVKFAPLTDVAKEAFKTSRRG